MPDRVDRGDAGLGDEVGDRAAGLCVRLKIRCARAGDGDAHLVTFVEDDAHPADVPSEFCDLAWHEQLLMIEAFVIARTQRVIDQQDGAAIGIHVRDAQDEVGVLCRRGNEDLGLDAARDFEGLAEHIAGPGADFGLLFKGTRISGSRETNGVENHRASWVARIRSAGAGCGWLLGGKFAIGLQEPIRRRACRREIFGLAPHIARSTKLTARTHDVIFHRRVFLDAVVLAFEMVIEPLRHVRIHIEEGILREHEFADLVRLRIAAMEPGANDELLLTA